MTVIDPLEEAAELTDWNTFVKEIEATIPFAESTSTDGPVQWAPGNTVGPAPIPGFTEGYVPADVEFVTPWHAALGDYYTDPASGVTVPLNWKGTSISPAFYDSGTKTWSVNPAYVAWVMTQPGGSLKPDYQSVPAPDGPIFYHGAGPFATWNDVYLWAAEQNRIDNAAYLQPGTATNEGVARAMDGAVGSAIKALGGLISQVADGVATLSSNVARRIDGLQLLTYTVTSNLNRRLDYVERVQWAITRLAIPSLQAQIFREKHNRQINIQRQIDAEVQRVRDRVYIPLNTDIQQNQITATQQVEKLRTDVPTMVRALGPELIAPALAATTALATRVAVLEGEAESCGRPMCATMGPNTDLGKFLKALKVAEWIALLAELAALRAGGLDELLNDIEGWARTGINTFESLFLEGGRTLGETITGIG